MSWERRREGWQAQGVAAEYDDHRFRTPLQKRKHANDAAIVLRLLREAGDVRTVLDAPTGTGRMIGDLERAGHRVVGVDLSQAMLAQASAQNGRDAALLSAEIERLPFADDAFDAAISLRFLFHVRDEAARGALLRELRRTSRWLVVHERARGSFKHASRYVRSRVGLSKRYRPSPSRDEYEAELDEAGWRLVRTVPVSRLFSDKQFLLAERA